MNRTENGFQYTGTQSYSRKGRHRGHVSILHPYLHVKAPLQITEMPDFVCKGTPVADPGENLTGALHSKFGHGGCGGRG